MSKYVTAENLVDVFPYSLHDSDKLTALVKSVAKELETLYRDNNLLAIYTRIDELPESMLDLLAYDFKVDWYLYDASITAKRRQIKSLFDVHKHLGTKAAMERALSDVLPDTYVEAWYEYGGRPYHFRVVYDISEQLTPISNQLIERMIRIFKSARDYLESGKFALRARANSLVYVNTGYIVYTVRKSGTYPRAAMQGKILREAIEVSTSAKSGSVTAPRANEIKSGTYPRTATQGGISKAVIEATVSSDDAVYAVPRADELRSGTYPHDKMRGGIARYTIEVIPEESAYANDAPRSGTLPRIATQGRTDTERIDVVESGDGISYQSVLAGTIPRAAYDGRIATDEIDVAPNGRDVDLNSPKSGELNSGSFPRPSFDGDTEDSNIKIDSEGSYVTYHVRMCGDTSELL